MEYVELGNTGLKVSRVCFGCWQMSGNTFWPDVDEQAMGEAVRRAIDLGVNFIDTADAYGDGRSESLLGDILQDIPRDRFVMATKVYAHWLGEPGSRRVGDLSRDYIIWECEQSLKRLRLDHIDLYQAHRHDPITPPEETAEAFAKLRKDGKIRAFGVSNFTLEQLRAIRQHGRFATLQPRYSIMDRRIEDDLLPYCQSGNIGVLVYSPLEHGLLTGKFTGDERFDDLRSWKPAFQGEAFRENVQRVNQMKAIADRLGRTTTQLALRALLKHPAVHCVIAGIKNSKQIEDAAGALGWELSREEYYELRDLFP